MSTSSTQRGGLRAPARVAPAAARRARRGARTSPAPNAGAITVGRVEQQRVRARAVAVGHDRTAGAAAGSPSSASTSAGSSAGQSPGTSSDPLGPAAGRRAATPSARGRDWPASAVVADHVRAPASAGAAARGSAVTTITSSSPRTRRRAPARRATIASASDLAGCGLEALRRAAAWRAETLDGQDGDGAHRAPKVALSRPARAANAQASRSATRRRPSGVAIETSVSSTVTAGRPARRRPARRSARRSAAAMPSASSGCPAQAQERVGRALEDLAAHERRHRDDRRGASAQRLAHARHGEDRPDRDHRVRRADHDRPAPRRSPRAPRGRAGRRRRRGTRRPRRAPARAARGS